MRISDIEKYLVSNRTSREIREVLSALSSLKKLLPPDLYSEMDLGALKSVVDHSEYLIQKKDAQLKEEWTEAQGKAREVLEKYFDFDSLDIIRYNPSFDDEDLPEGYKAYETVFTPGVGRVVLYEMEDDEVISLGWLAGIWVPLTITENIFLGYFLINKKLTLQNRRTG